MCGFLLYFIQLYLVLRRKLNALINYIVKYIEFMINYLNSQLIQIGLLTIKYIIIQNLYTYSAMRKKIALILHGFTFTIIQFKSLLSQCTYTAPMYSKYMVCT